MLRHFERSRRIILEADGGSNIQLVDANLLNNLIQFFTSRQCNAFLVGGYLRDALLALPSRDLDVAVPGDPQPIARQLAAALGGVYISISTTHRVARVVAGGPNGKRLRIDISGILNSIEEDLARRDFTVNAMALPLQDWSSLRWKELVLDPFNGREDLFRRCIRAVTAKVFRDDPARLLRAVRLLAQLRFRLAPETGGMIRADAYLIARVSGERIRDEFLAILSQDGARAQLEVLDRLDLLCRIIPELADTKGVEQPSQHYWDVWGHLLHTVETAELVLKGHQHSAIYTLVPWKAETEAYFNEEASDGHSRRTLLKLAGLLHDIAKPQTKKRDETGRTRFLGHSVLGATHSAILLNRLRLSTRGNGMVTKMVEQHLRPTSLRQGIQLPTSRAIYRYFRDLDDVAIDTLYLCLADYLAAKGPNLVLEDWADHARMVSHVLLVGTQQASHAKPRRLLTGHDLMERYGLIPGPKMGSVLEKVREARATGEITTQEEAFALVTDTLNSHSGQE